MVALLTEAFGENQNDCNKCSSRKHVIDWDKWQFRPISTDKCKNSIFYSKKDGTYQNGFIAHDKKCAPGDKDSCLPGRVDSSCKYGKSGSLKKPLCMGKEVDNYIDEGSDINLCRVHQFNRDSYYFTQTDRKKNIYKKCNKLSGSTYGWEVGQRDECQFKKPS